MDDRIVRDTLEWGWFAISLVGVVLAAWSWRESTLDLSGTAGLTNGRRAIAVTARRVETLRFVIHAVFLGVGYQYVFGDLDLIRMTTAAMLVGSQAMLVVMTIMQLRLSVYLRGRVRRSDRTPPTPAS